MSNNEEIRQVLKMVADGKISVDEADQLITAIQESYAEEKVEPVIPSTKQNVIGFDSVDTTKKKGKAKWFRIQVTDMETGKTNTNIRLPIGFGNFGLHRLLKEYDLGIKGSEFDAIAANIETYNETTLIIDVEDDDERVQIYIE